MALVTQELPLVCLMLLLLCGETGVGAQVSKGFFSLQQPQAKVSVTAGETLTLRCTTSGIAEPGPMRWLKGWGSGSKTIYDQRGSLPRVTRAVDVSDTDFTIHIRNVQPEDMGTYYCVKFVKGDTGVDEVFQRGSGTEVSVQGVGAQMGQVFRLQQPQANVSVTAGQTLTLNCTTSGIAGPGPMRWLKGWGSGSKTIYDQRGSSSPRVTTAVDESDTDFTIHIRNVQPEDMGIYYCVKFVKGDTGEDEVFQRGSGTEVSVQAKPSPPLVSGPGQRAGPEQTVPFTCTSGGFFPKEISVKWFKNKDQMLAQPFQVTEWEMKTFNMSSTVRVTLQKDDVRSQLICEVQHPTLPARAPLRGSFQLSRVLRVPPSVDVRAEPSPVEVNKTVTFSCLLKEFYPANVSISWLENGIEMKGWNVSRPSELPQGLFQLRSQVEVQATEERNGSTITCMVVHDAQAPANYSDSLLIFSPAQGGLSKGFQMDKGANLLSSLLLLCLGILLEKALLGGLLFVLFKRMKKEAS